MILFDSVYLIAMTSWVGSILFFSFAVAPIIFRVLGDASGARFVRALFPRYYAWGAISGAVALPAAVAVPLTYPEMRGPWVGLQAILIMAGILLMFYASNSLTPAINAARDEGPSGDARFNQLHRRSVRLNGFVLLLGLALIVGHAARPFPRTSGIVEPGPVERNRLIYEAFEKKQREASKAGPGSSEGR